MAPQVQTNSPCKRRCLRVTRFTALLAQVPHICLLAFPELPVSSVMDDRSPDINCHVRDNVLKANRITLRSLRKPLVTSSREDLTPGGCPCIAIRHRIRMFYLNNNCKGETS
jgi:hypothetical protein